MSAFEEISDGATSSIYFEQEHVHNVYNAIADHFSETRYKPWPKVESFLLSQKPASLGADVGCGNGKYLSVNPDVVMIGSDRSSNLIDIAHSLKPTSDLIVADAINLPHLSGVFDFAISIAMIHHFSTEERRIAAIKELLRILNSSGQALLYVWALEQKDSRRGWDETDKQDVMIPWKTRSSKRDPENGSNDTFYVRDRYYHLFRKGELEDCARQGGAEIIESGYERDNWWVVIIKG